jgi:epidermal growth factor receptor substrate 15
LDDDFEGLEDAKEGSADDDFANISRSGLDDFNPVFDSSPPPSQAAKSESANTNGAFGTESSFDFASLSTTSAGGSTTTGAPSGPNSGAAPQNKGPDHDWDAIFASLDDAPASTSPTAPTATNGNGSAREPGQEPTRPTPGRALTEEGKHDDPLLKDLTGMGYSRTDALSALEKYNYNLDRVSLPG